MSDVFIMRIKAAQLDLIDACGGMDRAAILTGFGRSTVGRWRDRNDPTLMPLQVIPTLEADCGRPFVTAVLAQANGRRLTDPEAERQADVSVMTSHAEVMRQSSELMSAMAMAMEDGRITPTEAHSVDRIASALDEASVNLRTSLAAVKARGGVTAALRVVGNGEE